MTTFLKTPPESAENTGIDLRILGHTDIVVCNRLLSDKMMGKRLYFREE